MSTPDTPSREAAILRAASERSIPMIARKAAEHIVRQLEPRFNEAYKTRKTDSFKDFLLISTYGAPYTYHINVIDMDWFNENGLVQREDIPDILGISALIVRDLLVERYGINTNINIPNGGGGFGSEFDFVFDWYALSITAPRKKKSPFWRFWKR